VFHFSSSSSPLSLYFSPRKQTLEGKKNSLSTIIRSYKKCAQRVQTMMSSARRRGAFSLNVSERAPFVIFARLNGSEKQRPAARFRISFAVSPPVCCFWRQRRNLVRHIFSKTLNSSFFGKKRRKKFSLKSFGLQYTRAQTHTCSEAHPGRWLLLLSVASFVAAEGSGRFFVATKKASTTPVLLLLLRSGKIRFFSNNKNEQQKRKEEDKEDEEEARRCLLLLRATRATKRRCKDKTERPRTARTNRSFEEETKISRRKSSRTFPTRGRLIPSLDAYTKIF